MGLEPDHVLPYLRTVRWPGDEREVAGAIRLLVADRDASMPRPSILVQMDIGREVEPRLGIELAFARRPQLRGAIAESSLLNRLVTLGLCTPAKREALASWPAYEIRTLRHELWPSLVVRRVNHVKIVLDRERPMSAKSYLCIHHAFRAGVDGPSDGNRGASLFLGTLPPAARDPTATRFA
jgi:hypothetical protein